MDSSQPPPSQAHADDITLMAAVADGDAQSLRQLYDRHAPLMLALICRILKNRSEAEDLLVDVFAELWQRRDRFDARRGAPLTYLTLLARSRAIDRLRQRPAQNAVSLESVADPPDPSMPTPLLKTLQSERRERVRQALEQLRPQEREVVQFAFYEGLSHNEIAQKLNSPLGSVKTWIRQGLIHLRDALRNDWGEPT